MPACPIRRPDRTGDGAQMTPQRTKATIFDVARRAGVSIKTVSRVVNGEPNVRERTRDKVLRSVRELRYLPNAAARELGGRRSRVIGLIYENAQEFSYLNDVFSGALRICEPAGYTLLLRPLTLPDPAIIEHIRQFALNARVEGFVLPAPLGDVAQVPGLLREMRIPFAAITPREPVPDEINILCNDEAASAALTELLIEQGHGAIGFIKGHPDHGASAKRFAGYRKALRKHRLPHAERLVRQGYFDFDSGRAAASELLDLREPPSAILASNDDMAAGVIFEARERGLSVPGDLSIAGFDDTRFSSRIWPPLTTVRQPIVKMAETATNLLIDKLNGNSAAALEAPFECEVVIRESTAALG